MANLIHRRQALLGLGAGALAAPALIRSARAQIPASYPNRGDETDIRGRTPVSPTLFTGSRTLILGITGQSKLANYSSASPYTPWTGAVFEFNPFDSKIYPSDGGPMLGCNGAPNDPTYAGRISVMPYILDLAAANNQFSRVLVANMCAGGTSSEEWCPIGDCYPRASYVLAQLMGLGLVPNYWLHDQGEADIPLNTSQTDWTNMTSWGFASLRSQGLNCTVVIHRGNFWNGISTANPTEAAAIVAAQTAVANMPGFAGGNNYDAWGLPYRVDGVHWNDAGRYAIGPTFRSELPVYP